MKKKIGILLIFVILTVVVFVFQQGCRDRNKLEDTNIVLIVIDTLRSDHLPFYGYKKNTAPFMAELAGKSVLFENTFAASSWTSPATASIFTSLYPQQHGVLLGLLAVRKAQKVDPTVSVHSIPENVETIPKLLKKEGYRTYGISDNINISERQGFTRGFDKFEASLYKQAPYVNSRLLSWKKEIMGKGKYFLYIHYMDPHAPYHERKPWFTPQADYRQNKIAAYDSEINFVDVHIKELFREFGWDKNTLVIITSDHGEGLWDHKEMSHGKSLYREEIQVPLFFYYPNGAKVKRVAVNVSTIDLLPTLRELLGLDRAKTDSGSSLVPLLEGLPNTLDSRDIYSYLRIKWQVEMEWKSTIYKNWHFVLRLPDRMNLFYMPQDKKEQDNKFETGGSKTAWLMKKRYDDCIRKARKYKQKSLKVHLNDKEAEKLKTLGYVN